MRSIQGYCILAAVMGVGWFAGKHFLFGNVGKGDVAGDFELASLDGQMHRLSEERGKVVVVDMWATWCPPCRESLPHLQKLAGNQTYADDGLVVWAVNDQEPPATIAGFMASNHYTFTALVDSHASVLREFGVSGIPTTVVIGRDGTVKDVFVGYGPQSAVDIDNAVLKALAG